MEIDAVALKKLREKDGWTSKAFAKAVDISPQYLCSIEQEGRKLSRNVALIRKMADVLDVPITMLTRRDEVA